MSPGHGKTTINNNKIKTVVLTTNPRLKAGVDSTPETLCEKLDNGFRPTNLFYKTITTILIILTIIITRIAVSFT